MSNSPDQQCLAAAPITEEQLEASHIDRVSSFVRSHRNSLSQGRTWISTASILPVFKDKKHHRNNSSSSFNSNFLEKVLLESPEKTTENVISDKDVPSYSPEKFGKLLFLGEGGIPSNEIITVLGKNDPYNASVLVAFMNEFDFYDMDIADAFRKVCDKIDIFGETQVVDRILFQLSKRYWDCNENMRDVFLSVDITYGILFSLVLLNTDLNIANIGTKETRKMSRKDFLKNTTDLIISMIENDQGLKDWSNSDKKIWKDKIQSMLKVIQFPNKGQNYYSSIRMKGFYSNLPFQERDVTLSRNSSTWSISSGMSSSSLFSNASSTASRPFSVFNSLRRPPRSKKAAENTNSSSYTDKDVKFEGLAIKKHLMEKFDQRARNRRWYKCRLVLKSNDEEVKLAAYLYDGKKFGDHEGSLPRATSSSNNYFKPSSEHMEIYDILHAVAEPLGHMSYSVKRPHIFSLTLGNGSIYLFHVPSLADKESWVWHLNFLAAQKSKEPLRDVLSSADYGWSSIEWAFKKAELDNKSIKLSPTSQITDIKLELQTWERPIHNFRNALVSQVDVNTQLQNFENQIAILTKESALHDEYKEAMESMYPDSNNRKKAFSNWTKKKSYLDSELRKYKIYRSALNNKKPEEGRLSAVAASLNKVSEDDD